MGYANEVLSSVSYSISNSAGLQSNLAGLLTGSSQASDGVGAVTNYFQCFDVALTAGLNVVTLAVTDLAGNQTFTNLSYTLDYASDTTPPAIALYWPQDGAQLASTNFTWRGLLDDETVQVTVQSVDANGVTNWVGGLVERNGNFWVDDLQLGEVRICDFSVVNRGTVCDGRLIAREGE